MPSTLYIDGENPQYVEDDSVTVALELPWETTETYRCRACGEGLVESAGGYHTESDDRTCSEYVPDHEDADGPDLGAGPHDPQRIPLSWANSAAIDTDEKDDSITVSISVGDPRGAFCFTVRRIPEDAGSDLAGQLVLHVPHAGQTAPHQPLCALHPGTFLIG